VLRHAARLSHWVAENARSARAFLNRVHAVTPLWQPLQAMHIEELPRPRKGAHGADAPIDWHALLAPALAGDDLGLMSEAGLPALADPGAGLVAAAHALSIPVLPLPGASSLALALIASGFNGQNFAFVGYLPQDATARQTRLKELETRSRREAQTQLVIETPYRNGAVLSAMLAALSADTRLSVSCGLTLPDGWSRSGPVSAWRAQPATMPERIPAVFCFLAV
jgi:16S rRNA (cytidine1402-2'-O)-methyltransferase